MGFGKYIKMLANVFEIDYWKGRLCMYVRYAENKVD